MIMKKYSIYLVAGITVLVFFSCIKQLDKTFQGATVVEIDATPLNSVAVGQTYPILTRIPPEGRPVGTACPDSTLRRFSGTIRVRVNLVGPQTGKDETIGFKIFSKPIDSIAFPATLGFTCTANPPAVACRQLPMTNSQPFTGTLTGTCTARDFKQLAIFDAVQGTHYNITSTANLITIPANSSYGYIDIAVLNPGATAGQGRFIGIRLDSTGSLKPNPNYLKLGLVIDQR
jgi:hypothetical protein